MEYKKCIRCGIQLHPTDWTILKELSSLPICDNCLMTIEENIEKNNLTLQ